MADNDKTRKPVEGNDRNGEPLDGDANGVLDVFETEVVNDPPKDDAVAHPTVSPAGLNLAPQPEDPDAVPLEETRGDVEEDEDYEVLVLNDAFFVTKYVAHTADGGTLEVDRLGTRVPADEAEQIVADAAANGVHLTRKAN